jgi:hypothetical protein
VSEGISERRRIGRYIYRITPPPLTAIAIAVDYANIALDPDVSLYERYNAVSTAVRLLAALREEPFVDGVSTRVAASGLCERFRDVGIDVCRGERGRATDRELVENLVRVLDMCERGEIPVTEELVLALAQATIVSLVPQLRSLQIPLIEVPREGEIQ